MKLTYDQVNKLKKGSVIYYSEWSPAEEQQSFDDVLQVVGHSEYSGPKFKVLDSKINKEGEILTAGIFQIDNGNAYAIPDPRVILDVIFKEYS